MLARDYLVGCRWAVKWLQCVMGDRKRRWAMSAPDSPISTAISTERAHRSLQILTDRPRPIDRPVLFPGPVPLHWQLHFWMAPVPGDRLEIRTRSDPCPASRCGVRSEGISICR